MIGASSYIDPRLRRELEAEFSQRMEKAAIALTFQGAKQVKADIRSEMAAAGLGRLGFAIDAGQPDAEKSGNVHRNGAGWSASAAVFVRSGSPRTRGAIESYTAGAEILPKRGRYLWYATDDIKRLARVPLPSTGGNSSANVRLEPRLWDRTYGRTLGPLFFMRGKDGTPLLVVRNATVSLSGKAGSIRSRTKTGRIPKGQVAQEITVAFIGIPRTKRQARINVPEIVNRIIADLPRQAGILFEAG